MGVAQSTDETAVDGNSQRMNDDVCTRRKSTVVVTSRINNTRQRAVEKQRGLKVSRNMCAFFRIGE